MARRKSLSVLSLGIGGYFTIRRTRYDSHCYDSVRLLHEDRRDPTPHGGTQLELLLSMSLLYVYVLGYRCCAAPYYGERSTLSVGQ